jgi:hypothetical protein
MFNSRALNRQIKDAVKNSLDRQIFKAQSQIRDRNRQQTCNSTIGKLIIPSTKQTGLSNQLTRQIGEHLVAAKLGRMGYVASPFAGNVPLFDILAADRHGHAVPIQVKAINKGSSWQYKADTFLDIKHVGDVQKVRGKKCLTIPDLIRIYILLRHDGTDEFYIFCLCDLQEITFMLYKSRKRPKNPKSTHCAVWPKHLQDFRDDDLRLITKSFDEQTSNPTLY